MQTELLDRKNTKPMIGGAEVKQYEKTIVNGKKTYTCLVPECSKKFKFKSEIKRHLTTHSNQRPFACNFPNCDKSFKRADALQSHMSIHTGKALLTCPLPKCKAQFNTKSALQYHILKHKGEKTYKCSFPGCLKSFLTFSHLKQHESAVGYHQKLQFTDIPSNEYFTQMHIYNSLEENTDVSAPKYESDEDYYKSDYNTFDYNNTLKYEEDVRVPNYNTVQYHLDILNPPNSNVFEKKTETQFRNALTPPNDSFKDPFFDMFELLKKENEELEKKLKFNMNLLQNNLINFPHLKTQSDLNAQGFSEPKIEDEDKMI